MCDRGCICVRSEDVPVFERLKKCVCVQKREREMWSLICSTWAWFERAKRPVRDILAASVLDDWEEVSAQPSGKPGLKASCFPLGPVLLLAALSKVLPVRL